MRPLYVAGLGYWGPGFPTLAARLGGDPNPACKEPACDLLPPRLARRASQLTRMTLEAVGQAAAEGGVALGQVPTIFATSWGEMQTLCDLLEMLVGDGQLSPTKFHNSVYNAAAGQFSVALGNQGFTTTLVCGNETVPLALLEAFCAVEARRAPAVIVALGDEAISLPLVSSAGSEAMACALCLVAEPIAGRLLPRLLPPRRSNSAPTAGATDRKELTNPVGAALPLLRALREGTPQPALSLGTPDGWTIDILGDVLEAGAA